LAFIAPDLWLPSIFDLNPFDYSAKFGD